VDVVPSSFVRRLRLHVAQSVALYRESGNDSHRGCPTVVLHNNEDVQKGQAPSATGMIDSTVVPGRQWANLEPSRAEPPIGSHPSPNRVSLTCLHMSASKSGHKARKSQELEPRNEQRPFARRSSSCSLLNCTRSTSPVHKSPTRGGGSEPFLQTTVVRSTVVQLENLKAPCNRRRQKSVEAFAQKT
jgi:hypothetical protein